MTMKTRGNQSLDKHLRFIRVHYFQRHLTVNAAIQASSGSARKLLVEVCGVRCSQNKNLAIQVSIGPVVIFLMVVLKDWTALSATPFDAGLYSEVRTCRIAFLEVHHENMPTSFQAFTLAILHWWTEYQCLTLNLSDRPCVAKITLCWGSDPNGRIKFDYLKTSTVEL